MGTKFEIQNNKICAVNSDERKIVIPEGITSIASKAFSKVPMEMVQLPSTLTTIESGAFQFCDFLNEIIIPEGVTSIEEDTFFSCSRLKKVELPLSLKSIKGSAFFSCESLEEISIPAGVEEIEDFSFGGCKSLTKVKCELSNGTISRNAFFGQNKLADKNGMTIVSGILFAYSGPGGDIVIPEGVVTIESEVFRKIYLCNRNPSYKEKDALKSVVFPTTLKRIAREAFAGCTELTNIQLPEGIEEIGSKAFYGCKSLKTIGIPKQVKALESEVFSYCKNLTAIELPEGLKSIGSRAFKDCKSLCSISIPAEVDTIEDYAFLGCESLKKFVVASANNYFADLDGILIDKIKNQILWYPADRDVAEFVVPESISAIASFAFCDALNIKKIVIPENVMEIGDEVFPRVVAGKFDCFEEIVVSPKAGSLKIGNNVFDFGDVDTPLIYPQFPLSFPREHGTKVRLGLGFCLNSTIFNGEYAEIYKKYVKSHEKTLLNHAKNPQLLLEIKNYYNTVFKSDPNREKQNYKKLSAQGKVKALEEAVLEGNVEKVKQVMEECKTFEFTAKVLGLACLYSSIQMVKTLVEGGATFKYDYSPALKRKYGVAYTTTKSAYPVNYSVFISKTKVDVPNEVLFTSTHELHFGQLPQINQKENDEHIRADIAEYLLSQPNVEFDSAEALFYSILWGCKAVAERLLQMGVNINNDHKRALIDTRTHYMRYEVVRTLTELSPDKALYAIKTFSDCLAADNKKLIITQNMFDFRNTSILNANILKFVFKETDISKISMNKVLELVIDNDDVNALVVLASMGLLETASKKEQAITYARKHGKHEVVAWLMNYKDNSFDAGEIKNEEKLPGKKIENPKSVSSLKKIWSYTKLDNGSLKITSYKGSDLEVIIPLKIGKSIVTVIGENAFTGYLGARNSNASRRHITKIVIPEGITEIDNCAFDDCEALVSVDIPATLIKIGDYAFRNCRNLKNISIPENVELGKDIFYGCTTLADAEGCVILDGIFYDYLPSKEKRKTLIIPEDVYKIAKGAFKKDWKYRIEDLKEIVLPESLKEIEEGAFEGLSCLERINIPADVKEIKARTFCQTGLREIVFPEGLQRIGEYAFEMTSMSEIHIPDSVTEIEAGAFQSGRKIRDIYIPASVVKFGRNVFGEPDVSKRRFRGLQGAYVHTPTGSMAEKYMKHYIGSVVVVNDDAI